MPVLGEQKVYKITFREIAKIIHTVEVDRNSPVQAQRLLSHCRCMFRFAKNNLGLIETNPCSDLKGPKSTSKRVRSLNTQELYLFWNNVDHSRITPVVKLGLKFMFCTLSRGIEVRKAKWSHINLQHKTWYIPEENAKNGRPLLLPLNNFALEILESAKIITGHSELVFGHHPTMNSGCFNNEYDLSILGPTAFSHALRDNFHFLGIHKKRFTPHDLRRTGATFLTSVGYPKEWVSKLLNHMPKDITSAVYDTFEYFEEKRAGTESINYILEKVLKAKSFDLVPSLLSLRKEFLSNKLVYRFLEANYSQQSQNTQQDFPAKFSNPVTYRLSYGLDTSMK